MTKKIAFVLLLLSTFIIGVGKKPAHAAGEDALVAGVNIYDAKILDSSDAGKIDIGFDLSNRLEVGFGIKYGVQLIEEREVDKTDPVKVVPQSFSFAGANKKTKKVSSQFIVDETVYPEEISLENGETVSRKIVYAAPECLEGKFQVWVVARNYSGMLLGLMNAGEVSLHSSTENCVLIKGETCSVRVGDSEKTYGADFGIDLSPNEKLIGTCSFLNRSSQAQNVSLDFDLHRRDYFGDKIKDFSGDNTVLQGNEEKTVTFEIPKTDVPQAYDAVLGLKNKTGTVISNRIAFHYVIQGESATIQNIILDKKSYQKGEEINVNIYLTPAADNFLGARGTGFVQEMDNLNLALVDYQGKACANFPKKEVFSSDKSEFFRLSGKSDIDCNGASLTARVTNSTGKILDERNIKIDDYHQGQGAINDNQNEDFRPILIAIIVLVPFLVLILFLLKRKKKLPIAILFLLFFGINVASADTFVARGGTNPYSYTRIMLDYCNVSEIKSKCYIPAAWPVFPTYGSYYLDSDTCNMVKNGTIQLSCAGNELRILPNGGATGYDATYTVNFNKGSYAPNEKVVVNMQANSSYCSNSEYVAFISRNYKNDPSGTKWKSIMNTVGSYNVYDTAYETAPASVGSYDYDLYGFAFVGDNPMDPNSDTEHMMKINVNDPLVINGSCDASGNISINWSGGPVSAKYNLRIDDISNNGQPGEIDGWYLPNTSDLIKDGVAGNGYVHAGILGKSYDAWIHPVSDSSIVAHVTSPIYCNLPSAETCLPITPPTGKIACPGTQTTGFAMATPWTDKGTIVACSGAAGICEYYAPAPSATCSPSTPPVGKTACPGTQTTGLSTATSWTDKGTLTACSGAAGICEYYTPAPSATCSPATPPAGKTACPGTQTTGLSVATPWTDKGTLASCSGASGICEDYTACINGCNHIDVSCSGKCGTQPRYTCMANCGVGDHSCDGDSACTETKDCGSCNSGNWHEVVPN